MTGRRWPSGPVFALAAALTARARSGTLVCGLGVVATGPLSPA